MNSVNVIKKMTALANERRKKRVESSSLAGIAKWNPV